MKITEAGLSIIKTFEGYKRALPDGRCQAYRCIVGRRKDGTPIYDGKWTIGWGCTEGVAEGMIWTREQAEIALRREVAKAEAVVNDHVAVEITQNQFDACVSICYNIGPGNAEVPGFTTSTVLRCINRRDFEGAADAFGPWVNSNGVKRVPGLVSRRQQEAALFRKPDAWVIPAADPANDAPAQPIEEAPLGWPGGEGMPQQIDPPSTSATHEIAHEALEARSWLYWLQGLNLKTLRYAALGAVAFVKDHPLEIALAILGAVIVFELARYGHRKGAMA